MAEFDNNSRNLDDNRENSGINSQNQYNKVPEYSFWAEQTPGSSYTNYNPKTNSWEYGSNPAAADNNLNSKGNEKKSGHKVFKFVMKSLCFGLIAGVSFIGVQQIYYAINPDAMQKGIFSNTVGGNDSAANEYEIGYTKSGTVQMDLRSAISDVIDTTIPSIVSINSTATQPMDWFGQQYDQEVQGSGSGFIVGKNDEELLIATNNHVVAGTSKITVTFTDGSEADAEIKGTDATADLAVVSVDITKLKKETLDVIQIAKLGNSDKVKVGEMAIAIGNALGYGQSVTVGYISAKDREVEVADAYSSDSKTMILLQTDAAINPGNSGGALLNSDGEVIGINTIKYANTEVEGMGYAIPISRAIPIINELMNREILEEGEQGYLGIVGNDVTEDVASFYNMPVGVFINELSKDGAAEKAGLQPGDIITAVDDIEVTAITQLRDYVNSIRVGTEVDITYMRNTDGEYQEAKVTVTLGANPELKTSTGVE
jgi:serine protease Do